MELQLTQSDISTLARMSFIAERETGKRFKLSKVDSVLDLLQSVAVSQNEELRKLFHKLVDSLDQTAQENLIYRGVAIPAELRKKSINESIETANMVKKSHRVYRGQVIEVESEEAPVAVKTEEVAPDNEVKKSRRVYRGRVIED